MQKYDHKKIGEQQQDEDLVLFYDREYYMFSNFASFKVEYEGVHWMTSEHAYQAAKFTDEGLRKEIELAPSSYDAYRIAHNNEGSVRSDWDMVKTQVMRLIVKNKLQQHSYIQEKLLETGNKTIVEDSPFDAFWGWGPEKDGRNELGKIWMELRTEMRSY